MKSLGGRRRASRKLTRALYATSLGSMHLGSSEDVLRKAKYLRGRVQLIFTSPPFALNRKKKYGNLQGLKYVKWLASYAPLFRDCLTEDGSIVIELGNGWEPDRPTMSTLAMEALLAFRKRASLHLCQEFICFNPARLPTPAQWVNVDRCRVKDAFTRVWWLSPTPRPKADNRHVLTDYSESMLQLLKRGTYNSGRRPSEHGIGAKSFLTNNGGAIPPNVLIPPTAEMPSDWLNDVLISTTTLLPIANTRAHDPYQAFCREQGLPFHPARMPNKLVEFFVRFLTDKGDLVVDPFAGSNTTGAVAERLGRRWMAIERDISYAAGSASRFFKTSSAVLPFAIKRVLASVHPSEL
jgi:hypothetical protein